MRNHHRTLTAAGALLLVVLLAGCGTDPAAPAETQPSAAPASETTADATAAAVDGPVDIGDRSLFMQCQGSEGPTVVLEAGLTGDLRTWDKVVPALPAEASVCAYDRANIGRSDPAPTPRTAMDAVADVRAALAEAGRTPPYVLVGFSFGGLVTQLYAAEHPDEVAGLVLVESNHPTEVQDFEEHLTREQIELDRKEANANPEGIDLFTSFDQVQAAGDMPEVPLVVVSAGRSEGWPPGWDAEVFDKLHAEHQADLATLVPGGEQMIAPGSGHHVPSQGPTVVAEAITKVLDR